MSICIVDTSVFCELLGVPGMNASAEELLSELGDRIKGGESLFLPMATILETGNHIGQNGDGRQRRDTAITFVHQVEMALAGESPFTPTGLVDANTVRGWLADFPNWANRGSGLGDLSIQEEWKRLCAQNPRRRVYIWSKDEHLSSYDRAP